jgi:hypothetical protein
MAAKKSAQNPYQWTDGTWHSIPASQHESNQNGGSVYVNGQRVTPEQYKAGVFLQGLNASAAVQGTPGTPEMSPTPQPVDPAFEAQKLGAGFNISTADGEAKYQKGETAWGTGYNADGSLNTSNPYSQAMLLQDNYKRAQAGVANSSSSALYSGARANQGAIADRHYAESNSALKDSTRQAYHGIDYGQLQTYGSNAAGTSSAGYNALRSSVYGG